MGEEEGSDLAKETDMEERKIFLASEDEGKRDSTMETVCPWAFSQTPFDIRVNEYVTTPVGETARLEEADMKRAGYEHMALVAPVALGSLGAMIA